MAEQQEPARHANRQLTRCSSSHAPATRAPPDASPRPNRVQSARRASPAGLVGLGRQGRRAPAAPPRAEYVQPCFPGSRLRTAAGGRRQGRRPPAPPLTTYAGSEQRVATACSWSDRCDQAIEFSADLFPHGVMASTQGMSLICPVLTGIEPDRQVHPRPRSAPGHLPRSGRRPANRRAVEARCLFTALAGPPADAGEPWPLPRAARRRHTAA